MGKTKKEKKAARPAVWTAVFRGVWREDPVTGEVDRKGIISAFTVAVSKEEALVTMINGLHLQYDDIQDCGRLTRIRRVTCSPDRVAKMLATMLDGGARFVVPFDRMTREKKVMLACVMLVW